jgi:hypothetical protein
MQVQGEIKVIEDQQEVGSNGFRKRGVVVETEDQYPQLIYVEFHQDKCDLLNSHDIGEEVIISINLRGREWVNPQGESRYFNTIQGWRIETVPMSGAEPSEKATSAKAKTKAKVEDTVEPIVGEDEDDLPF